MDPLGLFVIGAVILGLVLFYSGSGKGMIISLAIFADLGLLGLIMSGAWPLLIVVGIPIALLNYAAFFSLAAKDEE